MVNAANPMLLRSRAAIMKRMKTKGMIRVRSLRIVCVSRSPRIRYGVRLAARSSAGLICDRESSIDDRKCLAQLGFRNAQRRVREEIIPTNDGRKALLPEEGGQCRHLRRRAIERRHRFECVTVANELDDAKQPNRSDGAD